MTDQRKPARRRRNLLRLEALEDRTLPSVSVVEAFEGGSLAGYQTALRYAPSAVLLPIAAHDGLVGLVKQDGYEWLIRNDAATQVHVGDTVSVWTTLADAADGRAYLGFDARDNGTLHSPLTDGGMLSVVMAANTSQLLIQNNSGFNHPISSISSAVAATAQTYQANHWYRLEATWGAGGAITARLYDSDGTTQLSSVSGTTTAPFPGGGIALRAFGHDKYFDTVVVDTGSTGTAADRANAGGGLDPNWVAGNPPPPVGNNPGGNPAPVPWQYANTPGSGRDVSLAVFNDLQQVSSGGIVGGVVGLAALNNSAVGATQQIGWGPPAFGRYNSGIPLETPLLAQYLFRQLPGDQTRLIGASDVKHFFSSAHSDSHHLNPGENDTYGSGLNQNQTLYTDGSEIDPVSGTLHSAVDLGHNDEDNVAVGDTLSYANNIQHLLQVNVADLDPAQNPADTRWFLMGNLFVGGDQDTSNNSRWVEVAPHFSGTTFTFTYPNGAGGQLDFHTIPNLTTSAAGPVVISSSPTGPNNPAPISTATVTFDRAIDQTTFTPDKITSFTGPDGAHTVNSVTPVTGSTTSFTIGFDALTAAGSYTLLVGPDIRDTAGNPMDQNGNGIAGEVPGDQYVLTFGIRATQGELVVNGGFESGSFSGWTQSGDTSYTDVITGTPDGIIIHSGTHAARSGPNGTGLGYLSQTLATTAGTTYTLDFWLSHAGTTTGTEWQVSVGGTTLADVHDAPTFAYTEYRFTFTAAGGATALQFGFHEPPSFFYLDDVSVTAASTTLLVANGGFETGSFTGWTQSGDTSYTDVITGTPDGMTIHSGTHAARSGPNGAGLGYLSQTLATTAGTTYTLDFWLAHTGSATGTEWQVSVGGTTLTDVPDAGSFGYTEFRFTFTAAGGTTALQFGFHEPPSYFYLDDVSVTVTPPSAGGGGSESGSSGGRTQSGDTSTTGVITGAPDGKTVRSGANAARSGPSVPGLGYLTQTPATTAGTTYAPDFRLAHPATDTGTSWLVSVGGTTLTDVQDAANFSYTKFHFTFTARGSATILQFGLLEPTAYFCLDDG